MVGIESPVKEAYITTPYSYIDGYEVKQREMEVELENVRRQLEEERRVNEDLRLGRDQWVADMEATLQQSRCTLDMVQNRNIDLQAEVDREERQSPCRVPRYRPLTSPGVGVDTNYYDVPLAQPTPLPYPYSGVRESPIRSHRAMMSPAMPPTEQPEPEPHQHPVPSAVGHSNHSNTSNVAKQAWNNFVKLASDTFSDGELTLVSLETLKGLLKHYNIRDPIECARIEVYWRLLALQRESSTKREGSVKSHGESPAARRRSGSNKFVPVEHPRPFQVEAPKRGPHLSRRSPLRPGTPLSCNPNVNPSPQYSWATRMGCGAVGEKPTKRTYFEPLSERPHSGKRSHSQPVPYKTSSCPEETPSTFHPTTPKGLRTYRENPVAGEQTTQQPVKSGKRRPERPGTNSPPARSLKIVPKQEPKAPKPESVRYSATWRTDHLGSTTVSTKEAQAEVRGRRSGYPGQYVADSVVSPRLDVCTTGLRVTAKPAAVGNPNPPQTGYIESDKKGDKAYGLKVNDPDWRATNHTATLPLGGGFGNPVRVETVIPPSHVDSVRRTHSMSDLHGGTLGVKKARDARQGVKAGDVKLEPPSEPSPPSVGVTPPTEAIPTPQDAQLQDADSRSHLPKAPPISAKAVNEDYSHEQSPDPVPISPLPEDELNDSPEVVAHGRSSAGLPSNRIEQPSVYTKTPSQPARKAPKRAKGTVFAQVPRCAELNYRTRTPPPSKAK
eukprot:TRINITY_DN1638_c0_g1_i1.p1 TRINITY_DN1638_c0_g1~~TRINITY_DN1638_c0_g1_i1.p1  ORF type:complete len:724 (+),score=113.21 TRINITY_DN1638_c0_g1_i1:50-2221(+)